jgi:serine/threonine-protein kinase
MAVSRDGRHFVYNTVRGLYLRSMGALEARLIPGTEATLSNPFFSPDGQSVGFFRAGQLMRISIAGGVAVPICEVATPPFGASWERDDIILFAVPEGVMRVSARGGTPELVIPAKDGEQFDGPHLLPDGDSVLFSVTTAADAARWDAAQIVVQSLSGRQRTVVLQGGSDARYVSTGHLVYARGTTLFAVPFDISRLEVSGAPVSVVEALTRVGNPTQSSAAANYGVTEGGTLVSLRGGTQTFAGASGVTSLATLVWVDRRGHEEPLPEPPRSFVYPRLSPDGTQVALDVREQSLDIWVLDIRRQTMPRLTHSDAADVLPVWTPDGQRLVWTSNSDLYWQAADGTGTPEPLTKSSNYHRASSFTPDGQHLLLSEGAFIESAQDLVMISLKGDRRLIPLLQTKSSELNAEVSPNGRWVAYESDESGQFQIYVRPFPDVNQWKWTVSTNGGRQPLWARSGRELFYLAPDGTLMSSMVEAAQDHASFRTGLPARVMPNNGYYSAEGTVNFGRTYDVSPDGARFLRIKVKEGEASGGPRNFDVVLNWTEELKRLVPTK